MPLGLPPSRDRLIAFPVRRLAPGDTLHRIHRREHGVFWFSCLPDGGKRYDLPPPNGACYTARTPVGAWLEVYREAEQLTVDVAELQVRRLATITAPVELDLADLTAERAHGFGVTIEIHSTPDYRLPRDWAAALHTAGWRGLHGLARHDPSGGERTVTLLDRAGAHLPFDEEWAHEERDLATAWDLHEEAQRRFGYVVMPVPFDVGTVAWLSEET